MVVLPIYGLNTSKSIMAARRTLLLQSNRSQRKRYVVNDCQKRGSTAAQRLQRIFQCKPTVVDCALRWQQYDGPLASVASPCHWPSWGKNRSLPITGDTHLPFVSL